MPFLRYVNLIREILKKSLEVVRVFWSKSVGDPCLMSLISFHLQKFDLFV